VELTAWLKKGQSSLSGAKFRKAMSNNWIVFHSVVFVQKCDKSNFSYKTSRTSRPIVTLTAALKTYSEKTQMTYTP